MTDFTSLDRGHVVRPRLLPPEASSRFQWRVVDIPRHMSRHDASRLLAEQAEYGSWELARSVIFVGGARRVWLKRRSLKVERSDAL